MGWVRFLLAAAALPAGFGGIWALLAASAPDYRQDRDPVRLVEPIGICRSFQQSAVSLARSAQRDLDAAPALAFASASDALVAAELARAVCDPADWVNAKIRTAPPELQSAAYLSLAAGRISQFDAACEALETGFLGDETSRGLIAEAGQMDYARALQQIASDRVCTDRPRYRIGPPTRPDFGI